MNLLFFTASVVISGVEIAIDLFDSVGLVEKALAADVANAADQWTECLPILSIWEDEHLLPVPTPEDLARHKCILARLHKIGKFIDLVTTSPEYSDRAVSDVVRASLWVIEDKMRLWHRESP